ncbi:alpha beta hydrolase fold protein [Venturia nashicola]|uniref:Alpha beta hydrolase fold protein n=1 Tax=Venturia nashicola TaxID=86259 RepID=A0A4Z1PPC0_9PEZI|nr:alpha beta hydrolase fold protein [Venturia nashicola]TLD37863.1 alpha beta hydrolase fold protein [Venturia nashicola]
MPQISFFRPSLQPLPPLPTGIKRSYIPTPYGQLELLIALPNPSTSTKSSKKTPLFFAHSSYTSAAIWIPYMQFFSQQHQIPCYALSYRGHGASWYPSFLRMCFTRMTSFAEDLARGLAFVQKETGMEVVLVGHSSGGGLVQVCLDRGRVGGVGVGKVKGVVLAGSVPGFGSLGVTRNWLSLDKWFVPRLFLKHFGHPMSPLSSTALVKQAFFSASFPLSSVSQFETLMPSYESLLWPLNTFFQFTNFQNVLKRISSKGHGSRILILAGQSDKLVTLDIAKREAEEYRSVFRDLALTNRLKVEVDHVIEDEDGESTGLGVQFRVVEGAGHHFMNDVMWEEGANKLLAFYEQL